MRALEQLKAEHGAIKSMLRILEEICRRLESGATTDSKHLEQVVEFIKVFIDKCHHAKEEDALFPEMERAGVMREGGLINVMLEEHFIGRQYATGMAEAVDKYKGGDRKASSGVIENARNYILLLIQHIEKEDNVLYPMAEARIPEKAHDKIFEEFEKIEVERIGAGTHERFHELLHDLGRAYLGNR
jgi:hemerythrin-like domain-containing protein